MMKREHGVRRGAAVVVGILLLPFIVIACTATLERDTGPAAGPPSSAGASAPNVVTARPAAVVAAMPAVPALAAEEPTLRAHEVTLGTRDGRKALVVHLSREPDDVRHFALDMPERLVLDLDGPMDGASRATAHPIVDGDIAGVRMGGHAGKLRIVADLRDAAHGYEVVRGDRTVIVLLPSSADPADDQLVYGAPDVIHPVQPTSVAWEDDLDDGLEEDDGSGEIDIESDEVVTQSAYADDETVADSSPANPAADIFAPADETYATTADTAAAYDPAPSAAAREPAYGDASPADYADGLETAEVAESTPVADLSIDRLAVADDARSVDSTPAYQSRRGAPRRLADARTSDERSYVLPARATSRSPRESITVETRPADPRAPREYTGQRISLDFKDADIQNVLRILADVSGINIITTEDVSGKLTMRLVDVPWDQALDAILRAKGLDMVHDGNIIRVSSVEQLKKERDAQRAADEAQKQVEPLGVRYVKVNYAKADEALVKKVQEVLTERGSATWDERTNTIVIRDIPRGVVDAVELVTQFDTQTPQVLIESNIVEANDTFTRDMGIQWGYTFRQGPEVGNATGLNFPGRVGAGGLLSGGTNSPAGVVPFIADFPAANVAPGAGAAYDFLLGSLDGSSSLNARLTALERDGKAKIISRPRVVTLNNVPAKIESLEILRVRLPSTGTVISTGAGGVAGGAQNATEQIRTGITLEVTPQVSSDGYIFLDVSAKSSVADFTRAVDNIPAEISRQANSHVLIKDGETFVLGGVFRNVRNNTDRGVPYLRSVPVIGWAFKNNLDQDDRQELLVFVTPRTVNQRAVDANLASLPSAEALWEDRGGR